MDWSLLNYIIPGLVIVIAGGVVIRIYWQKLPKVAALDLEASATHRQATRKASLVEERLARKVADNRERVLKVLRPIGNGITWLLRALFAKVKQLEDGYRKAAKGSVTEATKSDIGLILQQAKTLYTDEKYAEAEKAYIQAIAADSTSVEAYRGLADVYVALKDKEHALETLEFLRQLNPNDEAVWREIGQLYKEDGALENALEAYEKAAELAPNNPKNLDLVIEMALANKLKYRAQSALDTLREVNPENNAIEEYQKEINEL